MAKKRKTAAKRKRKASVVEKAFAAVNTGAMPVLDGVEDLGVITVVDPYEQQEVRDGKRDIAIRRPKIVALRDDPVGQMHRRGQVDEVRLLAARHWQMLYERAEIGGAKAFDPAKPVIDGGRAAVIDTDARTLASSRLGKIDGRLGEFGSALVRSILGSKLTVRQAAERFGASGRPGEKFMGRRLGECLDTIAVALGYAQGNEKRGKPRQSDEFDVLAGAAGQPRLYDAVRRAKKRA